MAWRYLPIKGDQDLERNLRGLDAHLNGSGIPQLVALAADVGPRSLNTLADVTGLAFDLAANTRYLFEFFVLVQVATNAAGGCQLGVTIPSGATVAGEADIPSTADGTGATVHGHLTASGDSVSAGQVPAVGTTFLARVTGVVTTGSTAGPLQVQYALANTGASVTITVKAGTAGRLTTLT